MHRRRLLGGMLALPFAGVVKAHDSARGVARIVFNVAGIAYNGYSIASLGVGQPLRVEQGTFDDLPCFALRDVAGAMVGYVPKDVVPRLLDATIVAAHVIAVRRHAVPWRQVKVELLLA